MSDYEFGQRQQEIDRVQDHDPNKASSMQWQLDNDRIEAGARRQQEQERDEAARAGASSPRMGVHFPGAGAPFPRANPAPEAGNILRELLHWRSLLVWAAVFAVLYHTGWATGFTSGVAPGKAYFLVAGTAFVTSRTLRRYLVGCGLLCVAGFLAITLGGLWLAGHAPVRPAAHRLGAHSRRPTAVLHKPGAALGRHHPRHKV